MSELDLSRCPICQTSRRLARQAREVQGKSFIWFECSECSSVLMWLGRDRWVYQKIGRADRQYLLKRPLTTVELQALSVATTQPSVAPNYSAAQEPPPDTYSAPAYSFAREPLSDTYSRLEDEDVDADVDQEPAPLPTATETATTARPKGLPMSLVVAVAIIALLCVVAAAIIIATQL